MNIKTTFLLFIILFGVACGNQKHSTGEVLNPSIMDAYIEKFNQKDNELYIQYISNSEARQFLSGNIPLFECPDKQMEETYYFRWWTYRKHIKQTPNGFVITEFLPGVPWAGKYNAISCPAMLHFNEGRWLHNRQFLNSYAYYWLRGGGSPRIYTFPIAYALYDYYLVSGNDSIMKDLLPDLIDNFGEWEKERFDPIKGLFWQYEGHDGMEVSICGDGYRATINSNMSAEALAISKIARLSQHEQARPFLNKSNTICENMFLELWDQEATFMKVLPKTGGDVLCNARELHGYTPWCFNLAGQEHAAAWKFLMSHEHFYAPYGPTTAEQCHPGFKISYEGHECQWNGPSWPLATSITLTALANLLNNQQQEFISKEDYFELLQIYTRCHRGVEEDGSVVPWIDENINPFTGDWIARTRLKTWNNGTWSEEKGGVERGKDYNHSSYCDLIITGLIGIRPQEGNTLVINPLLPDNTWDYFCLNHVLYHGKELTVLYDKTGEKYKRGKGLIVFIDGIKVASSPNLSAITCQL